MRAIANALVHRTLPRHVRPTVIRARDQSKACFQVYRGIFVANKLAQEAGIGCRLLLKHPVTVWLPYDGSICKFGEQAHYKLSGRPSSRAEPRWELGAWVGRDGADG